MTKEQGGTDSEARDADPSGLPDDHIGSGGRLAATAAGTQGDAFELLDWALLIGSALVWGSSFLLIDIGIETFRPPVVSFTRLVLASAALAMFPRARRPVDREDLPRIALLGVVWMGGPMLLFPVAQQHLDSSVAAMINGAVPLSTTVVSALMLKRLPGRWQLAGLAMGLIGVVAISVPNVVGADASAFGVALVLLAVVLFGTALNLAVPLQQRYGSMPVLLRAQLAAVVAVSPFGLAGIPDSTWSWTGALAMVVLGVLCTGLAFPAVATLVGRIGGPRGSVTIYIAPVIAIILGVLVRDEQVAPLALVGTGLVIAGAWLTSRGEASSRLRRIRAESGG